MVCSICPRKCNIDRKMQKGFCGMGNIPMVAKACLHKWEEPCISGEHGSGTVFFPGCNLKCVYCQNYRISQENFGKEISIENLASLFLFLQKEGAHNINLVTPTHFVQQIKGAVEITVGLKIPVIYNSNGYESLECLKIIEGIADVYLPDFKYYSPEISYKYSGASDYFNTAAAAIKEMYRQVGPPVFDNEGMIIRGLLIRHLILPGLTDESLKILEWIKCNMPDDIYVSLMSQYTPYYKACEHSEINRRITKREYEKVLNKFYKLGFQNGYVQDRDSAEEQFIPEFDLSGI